VAVVAAGRLAIPAAALVTNMYLARVLPRAGVGQIQQVYVHLQIVLNIAAVGIQTSLYNFLPRLEMPARRTLVRQSVGAAALVGLILSGAVWMRAADVARWLGNPQAAPLVQAGALALFVGMVATVADPLFICMGRTELSALATAAGAIVQVAAVVAFVRDEGRLMWFFLAITAGQALRLVWALGFVRVALPAQSGAPQPWALLREQMLFALPVTLVAAVDTLSSYLDRVLVAHLFDAASLAVYTNGAIELPFIGIMIGAVMPVLLPHMAGELAAGRRAEVHAVWGRAVRKTGLILFGLFWMFVWIAEEFVVLLFSARYRDSAQFFRIYLLLLPMRAVAFMPMLYALGKARTVLVGAVGDLVLNLGLSLGLIRWGGVGMAGAAWGTVIATVLQSAFYLEAVRRAMGLRWGNLLPWRGLAADFGLAALWMLPLGGAALVGAGAWTKLGLAALLGATWAVWVALPRLRAAA
jgi:O-antigen/teichoic acid export membrane protein